MASFCHSGESRNPVHKPTRDSLFNTGSRRSDASGLGSGILLRSTAYVPVGEAAGWQVSELILITIIIFIPVTRWRRFHPGAHQQSPVYRRVVIRILLVRRRSTLMVR